MKKIVLYITLLLLPTLAVAQGATAESQEFTVKGVSSKRSFYLQLPDVDEKLVKNVWKDFSRIQFEARPKYDRKAKEYIAEEARYSALSNTPINVFAEIDEVGSNVSFTLSFGEVTEEPTLVRTPVSYTKQDEVEQLLQDFALEVERAGIRQQITEEEKLLHKEETEQRRLERANDRYHKEIEMALARIERMKEKIAENEQDQIEQQKAIEEQMARLEAVKSLLEHINY